MTEFATDDRFHYIDHLINVNSSICKRVFASSKHSETLRPTERLQSLGKKAIYLWEPTPSDIHQFALAYCTNGPFPEFRRWGFCRIDSTNGQRIARRVDYSACERAEMGSPPGFLPTFGMDV